jgi:hypothetical protein
MTTTRKKSALQIGAIVAGASVLLTGAGSMISEADKVQAAICADEIGTARAAGFSEQFGATLQQTALLSAAHMALQCYRLAGTTRGTVKKCDGILKIEEARALAIIETITKGKKP